MGSSEQTPIGTNEQKRRIRARYKGVGSENIEVIPCIEQVSFYEDKAHKRVAVYARVSTDSVNQTSSYELQKNYYEESVSRHPNWELVRIYADEGISGTSLNHRDEFQRMLADCHNGKIDLIVTKSVARFARNIVDCIGETRKLAALTPPVGVFFETDGLYTLNPDSEMSLSFIAAIAQEESHTKSRAMNMSYEMRFGRGIFLTPALLGFDQNDEGNLIINEDEAMTVRLCFFLYLYGYSTQAIAETLMKLGRRTKPGNTNWSSSTVLAILQNERHCGDVLAHKTWTPNYLDHKSKKNRMNKKQYYHKDHHDAIVSRDDFVAVQRLISNAKYGHKGLLPHLRVIESGALKGFVSINLRWAAFTSEDYYEAASSVSPGIKQEPAYVECSPGDFDLRGYEIARASFFQSKEDVLVTFSYSDISFSKSSVTKLNKVTVVELLFDPINKLFAVRPTTKENRNGVTWATVYGNHCKQKDISGSAFLPTLYKILDWKRENKYRIRGVRRQKENEAVLLFDLHEIEVFISLKATAHEQEAFPTFEPDITPIGGYSKTSMIAYPPHWVDSFGYGVYNHEQAPATAAIDRDGQWEITQPGIAYSTNNDITPSSDEAIQEEIQTLMRNIAKEVPDER